MSRQKKEKQKRRRGASAGRPVLDHLCRRSRHLRKRGGSGRRAGLPGAASDSRAGAHEASGRAANGLAYRPASPLGGALEAARRDPKLPTMGERSEPNSGAASRGSGGVPQISLF